MSLPVSTNWIFLLFLSGCISFQTPISKETSTALPDTSIQTQTSVVDITPFPLSTDYIFYGKVSEDKEHIEMWTIDPVAQASSLISKSV